MTATDRASDHKTGEPEPRGDAPARPVRIDWAVLALSGGLLLAFVAVSLANLELASDLVDTAFAFAAETFGAFWQVLMLLTFAIALVLASSRYGRVRLGAMATPEFSDFKWISMIMCTLLAGGGVFWAAAEPMFHFTSPPPTFPEVEAGSSAAVAPALAQSFTHWGFLAWAILGTLSTVVLMYGHYHRGMPLLPRTLLYPILGERLRHSTLGTVVDVTAIIAVAAGTIGPIGFLGLQASFGLNAVFGVPDTFATQALIILALMVVVVISAVTGLERGIQILSRFNVILAATLGVVVLLVGSGLWALNAFVGGLGIYLQDFVSLQLFRGDTDWLGWWTVFFFGWFLGYGPMMAIFISRISRGRSIRQICVAVAVIAPVATAFWFTVIGGTGINLELATPGIISEPLADAGLPAAMIAIAQALPLGALLAPLFLLLTITFVATTSDSMSYTMAVAVTGDDTPRVWIRVFWAALMGVLAVLLIAIGDGGVGALQSFIVVTAVPVSLQLLPTLWLAPRVARELAAEQRAPKPTATDA